MQNITEKNRHKEIGIDYWKSWVKKMLRLVFSNWLSNKHKSSVYIICVPHSCVHLGFSWIKNQTSYSFTKIPAINPDFLIAIFLSDINKDSQIKKFYEIVLYETGFEFIYNGLMKDKYFAKQWKETEILHVWFCLHFDNLWGLG